MEKDALTNSDGPIGVFDSGVGGLTVLKALKQAFPNESFNYLGDTARVPYGGRSPVMLKKYVEQSVRYLEKQNSKAIVVACNSASTVINEIKSSVPLFGVIEPSARYALASTQSHSIGVIGTRATIQQKSYVQAIHRLSPHTKVFQQACPVLVPLVEEGWDEDPITNLVVYRYLSPLLAAGIDTLILGCTHYPILKNSIQKVVGNNVQLIESGGPLVESLLLAMRSDKVLPRTHKSQPEFSISATDVSETFSALVARILSPIPVPPIERVEID